MDSEESHTGKTSSPQPLPLAEGTAFRPPARVRAKFRKHIKDGLARPPTLEPPPLPPSREPLRHSTRDKGHEEGGSAYAKVPRHAGFPRGEHRGSRHRFL